MQVSEGDYDTAGAFLDMVGFVCRTVVFADCISSRETLDKYAVSFIYDVGAYLKRWIRVPAHADASICGEPICFERILQEVFKAMVFHEL